MGGSRAIVSIQSPGFRSLTRVVVYRGVIHTYLNFDNKMIVCHCMNITNSQIIEKVRSGLDTVDKLARDCGITMGCGGCSFLVKKIIKEETNKCMPKTVRVLKLVSEYVDSPDGTDSYEVPKGWRSISLDELALSRFNNESPEFIEHRQFDWHNDTQPYGKKRIIAILYWYHDKTGVAFHKDWVYNPTKREGQWQISCFAFGCKHQFKELSQTECSGLGLTHYGSCFHVHECQLCKYVNSYDSSD